MIALTKADIAARLKPEDFKDVYSIKAAVSRCFACGIDDAVAARILADSKPVVSLNDPIRKLPDFGGNFACLECGKKFKTTAAAERAANCGCPQCGGSDIDLAPGTGFDAKL